MSSKARRRRPAVSSRRPRQQQHPLHPRSQAVLLRLHALPRWMVPLATALLVFAGLSAGPVLGGLCLLVVAGFLGWLAALAWPRSTLGGRAVRTGVTAALLGLAAARLLALGG